MDGKELRLFRIEKYKEKQERQMALSKKQEEEIIRKFSLEPGFYWARNTEGFGEDKEFSPIGIAEDYCVHVLGNEQDFSVTEFNDFLPLNKPI